MVTCRHPSEYLVKDCTSNGTLWAIKLIKLPLPAKFVQALFREIKLQTDLGEGHKNIITPQEVVLMSHYLGLVMEYAPRGCLTTLVSNKFREYAIRYQESKEQTGQGIPGLIMPEDEARYLFRQITNAVDYCHRHHVAHRDIKLDNTLLTADDPPIVKLCDFGFARDWGEGSLFTTVVGSVDYMSPQITAAKAQGKTVYDGIKADVWALGVLLCVMLIGRFPFEGDSVSTMAVKDPMKQVWVQQNKSAWNQNTRLQEQLAAMSPESIDLLDKMFELDEVKRIDVRGVKAHPWFKLPMRPDLEEATRKLEQEQLAIDKQVAAGAFHSKRRDEAIGTLIKTAGSEEFKKQAAEPITPETVFQIWSRIGLRSVQKVYSDFNETTLRKIMSDTSGMKGPAKSKSGARTSQSVRTPH